MHSSNLSKNIFHLSLPIFYLICYTFFEFKDHNFLLPHPSQKDSSPFTLVLFIETTNFNLINGQEYNSFFTV